MRYFGTNVERQTNIGGISLAMLVHEWGAPNKSATFKTGKQTQKKVTYVRGSFQLEFIFNNPTDLDHINLTHKGKGVWFLIKQKSIQEAAHLRMSRFLLSYQMLLLLIQKLR